MRVGARAHMRTCTRALVLAETLLSFCMHAGNTFMRAGARASATQMKLVNSVFNLLQHTHTHSHWQRHTYSHTCTHTDTHNDRTEPNRTHVRCALNDRARSAHIRDEGIFQTPPPASATAPPPPTLFPSNCDYSLAFTLPVPPAPTRRKTARRRCARLRHRLRRISACVCPHKRRRSAQTLSGWPPMGKRRRRQRFRR